jgi:hypothetical protein
MRQLKIHDQLANVLDASEELLKGFFFFKIKNASWFRTKAFTIVTDAW